VRVALFGELARANDERVEVRILLSSKANLCLGLPTRSSDLDARSATFGRHKNRVEQVPSLYNTSNHRSPTKSTKQIRPPGVGGWLWPALPWHVDHQQRGTKPGVALFDPGDTNTRTATEDSERPSSI